MLKLEFAVRAQEADVLPERTANGMGTSIGDSDEGEAEDKLTLVTEQVMVQMQLWDSERLWRMQTWYSNGGYNGGTRKDDGERRYW